MEALGLLLILALVFGVLAAPSFYTPSKGAPTPATPPYDAAYAAIYDNLMYDQAKNNFELQLLQIPDSAHALDVGCGLGHHVAALPCAAVGLDLSRDMVAAASQRYPNHTFVVGDALNARAFTSGTFTHVLCLNHTLYYFRRKDRLLQNIYYWLDSGGILALHVSDTLSYAPVRVARRGFAYSATLTDSVYRERIERGGVVRRVDHRFYFETVQTVLDMAKACGFLILSMAKYNPPYTGQYLYLLQKP